MKQAHSRHSKQRGISIIELMVALVLSLFLVGMVSLTYLQAASGTRYGALESQMNEEGALALELLQQQMRLAGYSALDSDGVRIFKRAPLRGCDGGFTSATERSLFDSLACNTGAGNDAIAVRYQATPLNSQLIGVAATPPGKPGNCANGGIDATNVDGVSVVLADNRFYIANDSNNDNAPTLWCRGSEGAVLGGATTLVPNVEQLQLRYAITRATRVDESPPHQVTALVDADHLPDNDWTRVAAVELCIVMRSARPVPRDGLSPAEVARFRDCNGQDNDDATDGRLRRAYRTMVSLPNLRPVVPLPYDKRDGEIRNPYAAPGEEPSIDRVTGGSSQS